MSAARLRRIFTWTLIIIGIALAGFAIGLETSSLGRTPGFGAIQMFLFLVGITLLTIGGFLFLGRKRSPDPQKSLQAEIGTRLSATGLVLSFVCGFSDLIGIGTHVEPEFGRPVVGPLQFAGLLLGLVLIVAGMALYATSRGKREVSSMDFLRNGTNPVSGEEVSTERKR